jgi:hypothetical protein
MKLALVVVLALFVSVLQCAASCTVSYSAADNLPPCHKHHSAPSVCHELVLSAAQQVSTEAPGAILSESAIHPPLPMPIAELAPAIAAIPDVAAPPSAVLRI